MKPTVPLVHSLGRVCDCSSFSVAVIKHPNQKDMAHKKGFLSYIPRFLSIIKRIQSKNSRREPGGRNMEQMESSASFLLGNPGLHNLDRMPPTVTCILPQ